MRERERERERERMIEREEREKDRERMRERVLTSLRQVERVPQLVERLLRLFGRRRRCRFRSSEKKYNHKIKTCSIVRL